VCGDVVGALRIRLSNVLLRCGRCSLSMSDNSGQRAGNQGNLQYFHFILQDLR
jgi:hypothetical protein